MWPYKQRKSALIKKNPTPFKVGFEGGFQIRSDLESDSPNKGGFVLESDLESDFRVGLPQSALKDFKVPLTWNPSSFFFWICSYFNHLLIRVCPSEGGSCRSLLCAFWANKRFVSFSIFVLHGIIVFDATNHIRLGVQQGTSMVWPMSVIASLPATCGLCMLHINLKPCTRRIECTVPLCMTTFMGLKRSV